MLWGVVLVAVGEHQSHVCRKLVGVLVLATVHLLLDGGQVHGLLDDLMVVVEVEGCSVHWLQERPSIGLEGGGGGGTAIRGRDARLINIKIGPADCTQKLSKLIRQGHTHHYVESPRLIQYLFPAFLCGVQFQTH